MTVNVWTPCRWDIISCLHSFAHSSFHQVSAKTSQEPGPQSVAGSMQLTMTQTTDHWHKGKRRDRGTMEQRKQRNGGGQREETSFYFSKGKKVRVRVLKIKKQWLIPGEILKHITDKLAYGKETRSLEDSPSSLLIQVHCPSIKFCDLENAGDRPYIFQ